MDAMQDIGIFAAQAFIIVCGFVVIIGLIALLAAKASHKSELEVQLLHRRYKDFKNLITANTINKSEVKSFKKKLKEEHKSENKKSTAAEKSHKKIYVIDFVGDVNASAVTNLREEITAALSVATPEDEIVVRVESPGGVVHGYGLAASQLLRIREKNIPLTVCVDKVAASGGYLMSVTANKILCAPFAIVGSIGVIAQLPNFHKLLKKHDVEYREYTAGEFKRTVSVMGEITPKGEEKFKEQLEETHLLFKSFTAKYRPQLALEKVATGEYWYGEQALALGLVDEIRNSDDYLFELAKNHQVIKLTFNIQKSFSDKIDGLLGQSLKKAGLAILESLETKRYL